MRSPLDRQAQSWYCVHLQSMAIYHRERWTILHPVTVEEYRAMLQATEAEAIAKYVREHGQPDGDAN